MEVQNATPMYEWRLMQEQCFSIFSIYVFGFWGFAPDLCRSSILGPPVVRRPLPFTTPWGISSGRPGLVNILSSSCKFILIGRYFEKSS